MPDVPPVIALVGLDAFGEEEALDEALAAAGDEPAVTSLDGPVATPSDVFDELRSVSMFGGRRVVVLREADAFVTKHRETLEGYLASPATESTLILRLQTLPKNTKVYKLVAKVGQVTAAKAMKPHEAARWLGQRAKDVHGLRLAADAARLLVDTVGVDRAGLDNELAKLALQCDGTIGVDDVAGGVAFRREQQMWTMTDAITRGDAGRAVTVWRQLLATDPSSEFRAVAWLAGWLDKAHLAESLQRQGRGPGEIKRALKMPPYADVDGVLRSASAVGKSRLSKATDALAELDYRVKTGASDAARGCESFIARLASAAR
ncbi:MAG: DNA polymerase III subunit delta [Planctomycetota bacterium]